MHANTSKAPKNATLSCSSLNSLIEYLGIWAHFLFVTFFQEQALNPERKYYKRDSQKGYNSKRITDISEFLKIDF